MCVEKLLLTFKRIHRSYLVRVHGYLRLSYVRLAEVNHLEKYVFFSSLPKSRPKYNKKNKTFIIHIA